MRILFIAEAVTLAHVGRPATLASALDSTQHEIVFACAEHHHSLIKRPGWTLRGLASIPSAQFLAALALGRPVYDTATLTQYVEDDLALLRAVRPDLVVGDFRLSLSVSARLAGVPYASISNAYWSPYARPRYTVPALPLTRLPLPLAQLLFQIGRPLAFAAHCLPLNRVRRRYGLSTLGYDLRRIYTDADQVLYADVPELLPTWPLPSNHHYLGPILWSPPVALPDWWHTLPEDRPLIYVTLGSSGQHGLLPTLVSALGDVAAIALIATAGARPESPLPGNIRVAEYLPGVEAARRARLVICNGGSPTTQQALAAGIPVLGIASNLDQFLNMHPIVTCGAGLLMRADRCSRRDLLHAIRSLLGAPHYRQRARDIQSILQRYPAEQRFRAWVTAQAHACPDAHTHSQEPA